LRTQKLKAFLELSSKIYPDLVKVLYAKLKFSGGVLKYSVKGIQMKITRETWKEVVG